MIQANIYKPLITVVGAASKQGRSVAHALLDSGRYRVRGLTRRKLSVTDGPFAETKEVLGGRLAHESDDAGRDPSQCSVDRPGRS